MYASRLSDNNQKYYTEYNNVIYNVIYMMTQYDCPVYNSNCAIPRLESGHADIISTRPPPLVHRLDWGTGY